MLNMLLHITDMTATCFGLILSLRTELFIFEITKMAKFVCVKYNRGQNERSVQDGDLGRRWTCGV
jgi:hypothetical protein